MKYSIKNMVCPRCVESVEDILTRLHIDAERVELGIVETKRKLTESELKQLSAKLDNKGFELVFDRESEIVNAAKTGLILYVEHLENSSTPEKLSRFLSNKTHYNYSYLSKVYSDKTGSTIEKDLIKLKIERVKELLSFKKWTLSEISHKMKYSSVQYLSNQFKKVTGRTVSEYLESEYPERMPFDRL